MKSLMMLLLVAMVGALALIAGVTAAQLLEKIAAERGGAHVDAPVETQKTVVSQDTVVCKPDEPQRCDGSPGDDNITGSNRADDIYAMGGADIIRGREGADLLLGAEGDDSPGFGGGLGGGAGDDTVRGEEGRDAVVDDASGDADRLFGGPDRDLVDGMDGDGRDTLDCGSGRDFFEANSGDRVFNNCEVRFF